MDESSLGDKNNFEYRCSLVGAGHEILVAVVNHDQGVVNWFHASD